MKWIKRLKPGWGLLPIAIMLVLWEVIARLELFPGQFYFPPFSTVVQEFYYLTANG
ncbi:MAG TPA: ABC transporter permease, partial [Dehalococcoidia bacterium]|nr:ABC transporter permease [Dehalococcoidia bacterium]